MTSHVLSCVHCDTTTTEVNKCGSECATEVLVLTPLVEKCGEPVLVASV